MATDHLVEARKMASDLLAAAEVNFDQSDKLTQALIGTFLFGMLSAHGMWAKLGVTRTYDIAIDVFQDVLHYTPEAAAEGVKHCVEATRPDAHPTMNAIIHDGIEGHRQYVEGDLNGLRLNIKSILREFER